MVILYHVLRETYLFLFRLGQIWAAFLVDFNGKATPRLTEKSKRKQNSVVMELWDIRDLYF